MANIYALAGPSTMMCDQPCEPTTRRAFRNGRVYRIADPAKRILDPRMGVEPVVFRDGLVVRPSDYRVLWGEGVIIFREPSAGASAVTINGAYLPVHPWDQ